MINLLKKLSLLVVFHLSNLDSVILKNKDEINKFYELISNKIKINDMKLLYRSSKDGLGLNDLKNKIDNKSNLIFIFLTGNTRIFGAFIKAKIKVKHATYIKDEDAFVFSLNTNKIYRILVPEYAIRFYNNYPVLIGNNDNSNGFYINGNSIYGSLLNNPKVYDFQKVNELTEGKNNFIDLEVFEINYK